MERIIVENVSKKFQIYSEKNPTALSKILSIFSIKQKRIVEVLKDVSFKVKSGEIVGIIGENGSGKSTLLRIVAGIYKQDSGVVKTNGKIISLINLYAGLRERSTMEENIYLIGSFFGLTRKEIKEKLKEIIDFSELQNYLKTKIYQFSEGMKQRLIFSIAVHSNPEILLLDEIFEIGDEEFRKKSADKIKELVKNNASVLLVSHYLQLIEKQCNKAIFISEGKIVTQGKPKSVIIKYMDFAKELSK